MNVGIILAGGRGRRFDSDRPKQFLPLRGIPMLTHSIRVFHQSPRVDAFCVVARSGWENEARDLLVEVDTAGDTPVVTGGNSRRESVFAGLQTWKSQSPESVFIHDGARPGVSEKLIKKLSEKWQGQTVEGVIPVLPVDDTLKELEPDTEYVKNTLDRDRLRRVQTPQLFSYQAIWDAHQTVSGDAKVTDDASLLELRGDDVATVPGDRLNRKITYPQDMLIVERLMEAEQFDS